MRTHLNTELIINDKAEKLQERLAGWSTSDSHSIYQKHSLTDLILSHIEPFRLTARETIKFFHFEFKF